MNDLSIRSTPHWLEGIYLALAGVPDLWALVDAPACLAELAAESGVGDHAWGVELMRLDGADRLYGTVMERWTAAPAGDGEGGGEVLARMAARVAEGPRPGAILVTGMALSRLVGNDLQAMAGILESRTGVPARVADSRSLARDWLDAFGAALEALAAALPDEACRGDQDSVAVVGHLMERPEADGLADGRELRRLVESLGVAVSAVWIDGSPVAGLARAGASRRLLALPGGRGAARVLAARTGAEVLEVPLPVGLGGTAAWLQAVGDWLGRPAEARAAADAGLARVGPPVAALACRGLAGSRVGVVAEPALAEGLQAYLQELGVDAVPPLLRCRRPAGAEGTAPQGGGLRRHDPSLQSLHAWVREAERDGPLDLVVGSSRERELLRSLDLPFLESGYPSVHWRPLVDDPRLGFAGALNWVHRLANRLAETRFERLAREARP